MKLNFKSPTCIDAGFSKPKGDLILNYTFECPFTPRLARDLNVLDQIYDGPENKPVLRVFFRVVFHHEIDGATIEFVRPQKPNGDAGCSYQLDCSAQIVEVEAREEENAGRQAFLKVKLFFKGVKEKAPAFEALLASEAGEWREATLEGKQMELLAAA